MAILITSCAARAVVLKEKVVVSDWYFYVDNKETKMYVNTKTLTADGNKKVLTNDKSFELKNWATKDKNTGNITVIDPHSFNESTIAK